MGSKEQGKKSREVKLRFRPGGTVVSPAGETILNAAWRGGVPLEAPCGGKGHEFAPGR